MGSLSSYALFLWLLIYCNLCLPSLAILNPIDFLALQSIRKSLEDMPGSNFFSTWDFTSDPCNFAGVYCEGDKVIALNLGDPRAGAPGLSGRLHPSIGKLSALAEFSVVPGRIMGALPETLSQLKNLRFLAISKNFISGQIPPSLAEISTLRTLDLSYNQLSGTIPRSIGSLNSLTNLILCHNHFTGSIPQFFSQTLTRFDLKHNNLSGSISPYALPPSIQFLSLSSNRFSGRIDNLLNRLSQLSYLDLSMNQFIGNIPNSLFTFPMTNLQLQRNFFSGPIRPLDHVTISTVDLSYNRLSGQISPMLASVQNLYLNNNKFTGQVPGSFVNSLLSASTQILYLQHNYLTGIQINPTAAIPLSSSLCLQYNCMVPPVQTTCPLKAGYQRTRPTNQCIKWRG
ncbi:hypothetical protein ACHQM5_026868 [Ranunculus cassubicifolius]